MANALEYDKDTVTESFAFGSYRTYSPVVGLDRTQNLGEKKDFEGYLNVRSSTNIRLMF